MTFGSSIAENDTVSLDIIVCTISLETSGSRKVCVWVVCVCLSLWLSSMVFYSCGFVSQVSVQLIISINCCLSILFVDHLMHSNTKKNAFVL